MEMERVARAWAETGQLANPYILPTGPTAHVLPVYPVVLGTIYRICGTGHAGQAAQGLFSAVLAALRCALILPLALFLGFDRASAALAAALGVLYIPAFATELRGGWEAPLAALLLMALVYAFVRRIRQDTLSLKEAGVCGVLTALCWLTSAALIPVAAGYAAITAFTARARLRQRASWIAVYAITTILFVLPWGIRNEARLGRFILLRSNLGLEVWMAYHAGASAGALDPVNNLHPAVNLQQARRVQRLGEIRFNQEVLAESLKWIQADPLQAAKLTLLHFTYFWLPPAQTLLVRLLRVSLTLLAWAGCWMLWRTRHPAFLPVLTIWLTFPLIYIIVYWSSRYRYPIEWTLLLCAAFFIAHSARAVLRRVPFDRDHF